VESAKLDSINLYQLMEEAGNAVTNWFTDQFNANCKLMVVAGTGNNGGDGYVTATQLLQLGYAVVMCSIKPDKTLMGDAETARQLWLKTGEPIVDAKDQDFSQCDAIVDGLLGTGLDGAVRNDYQHVIERMNASTVPIYSIDIPSGIHADTGASLGASVRAQATITFIGIKSGLVTGNGKFHAGELTFAPLSVGDTFSKVIPAKATLIAFDCFDKLPARSLNSHKGNNGRLLCIGGNKGMAGAIRLSAEAALRCGAGLVKVYCHSSSVASVLHGRPEIMASDEALSSMLDWADCIVLGPGLGQDSWSHACFEQTLNFVSQQDKPMVIDADGLNLLSKHIQKFNAAQLVITPHAAEAARLLALSPQQIESDRFNAAALLHQHYSSQCVLKGAGSVVHTSKGTHVCADGNPGMSSAGMGDILSGVLGALMAQGMDSAQASVYGTCLHSAAADKVARKHGQRGMIASDLFKYLRKLVN
jgi:NAD(P)H-hydrate epimerase